MPIWAVAALFGLLHLGLTLLVITPAPHLGGDNAAYLALAEGLRSGRGLVEMWDPALRPNALYPPGFPAILAAAMALGIKPWLGFKLLVAVFSALAVALSTLWICRLSERRMAIAVGLALAVAPGVVSQSQLELSDMPFWFFTITALWAFSRAAPGDAVAKPDATPVDARTELGWTAIAAVATACAWLTRTAGLPLLVAAVAWLALRRRWRALAVFVVVVGPAVVWWWMWQHRVAHGGGYASAFWWVDPYRPELGKATIGELFVRVLHNTRNYAVDHLPDLLLQRAKRGVLAGFGVVASLLALAGWARHLRRPRLAEILFLLYVGLIVLWPDAWADERFLLPILPLFLLYAGEVIRDGFERLRWHPAIPSAIAGAATFIVAAAILAQAKGAAQCRRGYPANLYACYDRGWASIFTLYTRTRGTLPMGSVVITRKPTLFWAMSGYRSRLYPLSASPDTFFAAVRDAHARFVVFDGTPVSAKYLRPVVLRRRDQFCIMRSIGADVQLARIGQDHRPLPRNAPRDAVATCPS